MRASHIVSPQSGFALIIAISLMAFILLLVITLTTLVRVESQASQLRMDETLARQNALLAMNIALGKLSKLTGPDQRITASAEIFDSNPASESIENVANNNWVGVWDADPGLVYLNDRLDTNSSYYDYDGRRDGSDTRFLGWLVSGDYDGITDRDSNITDTNSVVIFGNDFDSTDSKQVENQVSVQKVAIDEATGSKGNYAFWVSDENVKARIDGYAASANFPTIASENLDRSRFIINQRSAIENMDGEGDVFSNLDPDFADFAPFVYPDNLSLAKGISSSANALTGLNQNTDGLTTHSISLLTDSYQSGLKTDLSSLLRDSPGSPINIPDGVVAFSSGSAHALAKYPSGTTAHPAPSAPTWEQLKSFHNTLVTSGDSVTARKHTETQHGLYPVITRFRLDIRPFFEKSTDPTLGDRFYGNIAPAIVMVNPYNIPLRLPDDMYVNFFFEKRDASNDRGLFIGSDWAKVVSPGGVFVETFDGSYQSDSGYGYGNPNIPNYLDNGNLITYTDPAGIEYVGFSFRMPKGGTTLAPGEVKSFGIATSEDGNVYTGDNHLEAGAININPNRVRLINRNATGTELRSSLQWAQLDAASVTSYREQGGFHFNIEKSSNDSDPSRITPFNVGVGLSGTAVSVLQDEDFYQFIGNIESSNPNANQLYSGSSFRKGRNSRPLIKNGGFFNETAMEVRGLRFDVALASGFDYLANDLSTSNYDSGYRINSRWLIGHNFRAPMHFLTSVDDPVSAPNTLYGATAGYSPAADNGNNNMHFPEIQLSTENPENALWGTGITAADGLSQTTFFDLPRTDIGIQSLGQLQHMLISETTSSHLYGFGNGVADLKIGNTGNLFHTDDIIESDWKQNATIPVDQSFLLNDALWDAYFFSGLTQDVTQAEVNSWSSIPLNNRYLLKADATEAQLNDSHLAAEDIYISGGFNINSTDVEAWKAVLAGANNLSMDPTGTEGQRRLKAPISRTGFPLQNSGSNNIEKLNGYRELDEDSELTALAQAIVTEVKERGPFLSLSDFVNRRLIPDSAENGLYGTLEAGIRASNINSSIEGVIAAPLAPYTISDLPNGRIKPPAFIQEVLEGSLAEGVQQWIAQGDLLQRIAPFITSRSDTFVIYGYGETLDPLTNEIVTSATCEAVVQRIYEYTDSSTNVKSDARYEFDSAAEQFEDGPLSELNKIFGRKYKIVSLRWL